MNVIKRLKTLHDGFMLLIIVVSATGLTIILTCLMSLLFHGVVTHDYLVTGTTISIIVSTLLGWLLLKVRKSHRDLQAAFTGCEEELAKRMYEIELFYSILPTCSYCKKIKDEDDEFVPLVEYVKKHPDESSKNVICPDCVGGA